MSVKEAARVLAAGVTFLFVPGDRADRFASAWASGADGVILDLEASVHPDRKAIARDAVASWLRDAPSGVCALVRVNRLDGADYASDRSALEGLGDIGLMIPASEWGPALEGALAGDARGRPVVLLVETARGIEEATRLAGLPGVCRLAFGNMDYETELGLAPGYWGSVYPASRLAVASRCAGLAQPMAGVTAEYGNREKLLQDIAFERGVGFGAKLCIHPRQVEWAREAYAPTASEIDWARKVVAATSASHAAVVEGQMIDRPVIERALNLLRRACAD